MSDPHVLKRILDDLAAGDIDTARAAELIAGLEHPGTGPDVDAEALYDTPPQRSGPDAATPRDEAPAGQERSETNASGDGSDTTATPPPLFTIEMDDLAATAGDFVRDASGFARHAFERIGNLASSVRQGAAEPPADTGPQTAGAASSAPRDSGGPRSSHGVDLVVLRSVGRRVRLIGDANVATVAVEGPHVLRRRGTALEISTEGEIGVDLSSFSVIRPPRTLEDLRAIGLGQELVVRINPAIVVDAEVTGGRLITIGVPHLGKIRVSAGSANLNGVTDVADALVQAGGATLTGPISDGRSRVRVESGNLTVRLAAGSNVTVRSQTQLGKVSWPGEPHGVVDEYVVGAGSATLEIGVVMGRAVVRVEG